MAGALIESLTLLVRFLLELCALTALGYWGAHTGGRVLTRVTRATAAVITAAVAWALIVAPNAPIDAGAGVRWAVEVAVFTAATGALLAVGRPRYGVALAGVYLVNRVLMMVWSQ